MVYAGVKVSAGLGFRATNLNDFYRGNSMVAPIPVINTRIENFFIDEHFNIGVDFFDMDAFTLSLFVNPLDGVKIRSKDMKEGYQSIDNRNYQISAGLIVGYDLNFYNTRALVSVSGGKNGVKGNVRVLKPFAVTDRFYLVPSLGGNFYSKDYADYYWGVDKNETGGKILEPYSADSAYSAQLELMAEYYLTEKLTLLAFMSVERFSSDVDKSPIIDNNTLLMMGAGFKFSF
ncbi:MAG: MipA/OmpV family protein [Fusobacteriaceae bacterium]|nr:MipA/OmpV family protein [Fusobacteriaceae bacterium]